MFSIHYSLNKNCAVERNFKIKFIKNYLIFWKVLMVSKQQKKYRRKKTQSIVQIERNIGTKEGS